MAGTARQSSDPIALLRALQAAPEAFGFFEALRRIECVFPTQPRLGRSARPADDPVRLCHAPSLAFAPRMLDSFEPGAPGLPPRLRGLFFGVFGPHAPLPLHLTEYALDRLRHKDSTLVAFADIFHHRMLSLFYRAWAQAQPAVQHDRPAEEGFRLYLDALAGQGMPSLRDRDALPGDVRRHFAGLLWQQARHGEGLCGMLESCFRVPVTLVEFVVERLPLPASERLQLGGRAVGAIGHTAVLGVYARSCQHRFRLRVGPLDRAQFQRFLPGGEALPRLIAAVRTYVGDEQAWDMQLVLRPSDVVAAQLGRQGGVGLAAWLGRPRRPGNVDDTIVRPAGGALIRSRSPASSRGKCGHG